MNFEKLTGLGIGSWGLGEDPKKKHTNLVLDHESTDSRSGTFYFV
ncbi:hypothetical protein [Lactobacillus crispatus]